MSQVKKNDEEKRWPFDGFFLKLTEAQKEYEQEQHIDPASLTEAERQREIQKALDYMHSSQKKRKDDGAPPDPIVPENTLETVQAENDVASTQKQYMADFVGDDFKRWKGMVLFDTWEKLGRIPAGQHYRLPVDYRFVSSVKFFYYGDEELDIIRRVKPGEKILVFVETVDKLRRLRDRLKAEGMVDVACLCSKYRKEAKEFDKQEDVLKDGVLLHQITLTTTTLYNGVDIKDRALKHIVSELWNPLVNAQILGRKRPLDADDTCAVYFMGYGEKRLRGLLEDVKTYQFKPARKYRRKSKNPDAWREYLRQDTTQAILNTSHKCHTVVLDPLEGRYCLRRRAYLQALLERKALIKMLRYGYKEALLKAIDESLIAKVERLDPPPLLDYLDAHLNEERYCEEWQKIFFEMGHIYNKEDRHIKKSWPGFTRSRGWLLHHGYDLHKKRITSGKLRNKMVWWVTKQ